MDVKFPARSGDHAARADLLGAGRENPRHLRKFMIEWTGTKPVGSGTAP